MSIVAQSSYQKANSTTSTPRLDQWPKLLVISPRAEPSVDVLDLSNARADPAWIEWTIADHFDHERGYEYEVRLDGVKGWGAPANGRLRGRFDNLGKLAGLISRWVGDAQIQVMRPAEDRLSSWIPNLVSSHVEGGAT